MRRRPKKAPSKPATTFMDVASAKLKENSLAAPAPIDTSSTKASSSRARFSRAAPLQREPKLTHRAFFMSKFRCFNLDASATSVQMKGAVQMKGVLSHKEYSLPAPAPPAAGQRTQPAAPVVPPEVRLPPASTPPLDWSLKTQLRFKSDRPFRVCEEATLATSSCAAACAAGAAPGSTEVGADMHHWEGACGMVLGRSMRHGWLGLDPVDRCSWWSEL